MSVWYFIKIRFDDTKSVQKTQIYELVVFMCLSILNLYIMHV